MMVNEMLVMFASSKASREEMVFKQIDMDGGNKFVGYIDDILTNHVGVFDGILMYKVGTMMHITPVGYKSSHGFNDALINVEDVIEESIWNIVSKMSRSKVSGAFLY